MLSRAQDAYGHMLLAHLEGRPAAEIVERDDGFIALSHGSPLLYFADFEEWPPFQRRLLRACRGRVLDVGCGAGRASLALQALGHNPLAVDISPLAVAVARRRGVDDARVLSVTQLSRRHGRFDSILMFGNNLGLLGGVARGRWMLRRWRGLTSPDARIVAETTDPYRGGGHSAYHRRNRRRGRLGGQLRIRVRYHQYKTPWFDYLLVSRRELESMVRGTGWQVSRCIPGPGPRYGVILEKVEC